MGYEDGFVNKYSLVRGAAKRARQLQSGAPPLATASSNKACRVAQEEIRKGLVRYVVGDPKCPTVPPVSSPGA